MIANLFVSTFLSLKAHKLRVFLTMVGIIIGITSVVTISALGEGMKRQVVKASSAVNADVLKIHYTMSDGSSDNFMSYEEPDYTFSRVDLKKLQDIQGIESIYPQYGESMMGAETICLYQWIILGRRRIYPLRRLKGRMIFYMVVIFNRAMQIQMRLS